MLTVGIAVLGGLSSVWLARGARRYAVLDRVERSRSQRALPSAVRRRLESKLDAAMIDTSPEHAVQVWLLAAIVVGIVGVALAPAVGLLGVVAVLFGGPITLHTLRLRRARAVTAAVPATLDRVASELRTGGTVSTAVNGIAHEGGVLAIDFARIEARVRLGAPLPDALEAWSTERSTAGAASVAGALAVAHEVGGRAADALESLGESLRDRLAVAAEAHALAAQARYSALVIGLGPLGYLAFSLLLDRRAVVALTTTSIGRACALAGLLLELVGAWWMRRILAASAPA